MTMDVPAFGGWLVLDALIDVFFMFDIMLNFFTAFDSGDSDLLVTDRKKIAMHYITGMQGLGGS